VSLDPRLLSLLGDWINHPRADGAPPIIGIGGCQGSGKTTYARQAAQQFGAAHFSIDDIYLTKAERQKMAAAIHPLFAVRGVPGTHDITLGQSVIDQLSSAKPDTETPIPAFDKLQDDRAPQHTWPVFKGRPTAIIIDGWCVGATPITPDTLTTPVNALEREQDAEARWRTAWNKALTDIYRPWFDRFDKTLYLAAPSFDVVVDWRSEQEAGLMQLPPAALPPERRDAICQFIAYYEHLTRHMLAGGVKADAVASLDTSRSVCDLRQQNL